MILNKIAYRIKQLFGKAKHQELFNEFYPQISELQHQDSVERLNSQLVHIVEHCSATYGVLGPLEEASVENLRSSIDTARANEQYLQAVEPDLFDVAEVLAKAYHMYDGNDGVNKYFPLACELHKRLIAVMSPFVGIQPMHTPKSYVHTLRVQYADEQPDVTLESANVSRMSIRVLRETVEAVTRRFSARKFSGGEELLAAHGMDSSAIDDLMVHEMVMEVMQEMTTRLRNAAGKERVIDVQGELTGPRLALEMARSANIIAQRTRRGAGNWVIVSPAMAIMLHSANFTPAQETTSDSALHFVGTLNETLKVYCDPYLEADALYLMGYKGSSEVDTGVIYSPFVPVLSTGVVTCAQTGEEFEGFVNRAGWTVLTDSEHSMGNATDYFDLVRINLVSEEPVDEPQEEKCRYKKPRRNKRKAKKQ